MDRRDFLVFAASTAVLPQVAVAQNNARTIKIGWLTAQEEMSLTPYLAAMRQGLFSPEAAQFALMDPCNPSSIDDLRLTSIGSRKAPSLPSCRSSSPRNLKPL
jgi:hypothetical protein